MTSKQNVVTAGDVPGRPARPVGYWERIDRIDGQTPPLTDHQRARLRTIFHQTIPRQEAA
ncbi:hypothetical protein QCN29_26950 [Streptomyces sp. HNM0663]|uniref:Uncharacterized protein n=1 Tax=Streptomyces chengmaiensis TaxID=3040919 RepID=A0ABT6HUF6_9ACTN|nr:hypothetical protein [Streptomyces chengmaiensis]MDH2392351.1 hypothetical protein [Streptomyces chengmaiensis]